MVELAPRVERTAPVVRAPGTPTVLAAVFLGGLAAIVIARWWTGTGYLPAPVGLPDPGALTAIGLPVTQFVHEIAGVAVVGLLFLRAVLLPRASEPARAHLAAITVRWAWLWAGSTVAWIAFTLSDLIGTGVGDLLGHADAVVAVSGTDRVLAECATLWVALAVALFGARLSGSAAISAALVISAAALLPSALTGHAGHHASPGVAMAALGLHLVGAAIWIGGLLALVAHLRGFPDDVRVAVPRFSAAALVCALAVGVSGVLESAVMLDGWAALLSTDRGHLIVAKTLAFVLLTGVGYWHRRRTVPAARTGCLQPLLRLAAGELLLMGATVGIAVVLSITL
jgi:putative copper export protein